MIRLSHLLLFLLLLCVSVTGLAQVQPPAPGAPRPVKVPAVADSKLPNGLSVAVIQKSSVPLVTIELLIRSGASSEDAAKAGLADLTALMLTKGTKTRTASQIAEQIEFLGGSINSGAGWDSTSVSVTVTSDKVEQAMAILADVVLNPVFDQKELNLLRSQSLDGLTYSLKQPSFLASYVASKFSFGEHPAGGTPASLNSITKTDVEKFYRDHYTPASSVLIFTGDIGAVRAKAHSKQFFGGWKNMSASLAAIDRGTMAKSSTKSGSTGQRLLVIDVPKSGQASVAYAIPVVGAGRLDSSYYAASVLNSVLGGGYSSRLNYEIRIKRGLSYGAGSAFSWRSKYANFSTRVQTKNESAAEVASLILAELDRLAKTSVSDDELVPRKSVLTGTFGRNLESTGGLANALADVYSFGISTNELNSYVSRVNAVTSKQIEGFASTHLVGGDIIIVGDYSIFKDDLAKRFPDLKVNVIKADDLDLTKSDLRK